MRWNLFILTVMAIGLAVCSVTAEADWPQYRGDSSRGAYTPEGLQLPLQAAWTFDAGHAPSPAWPRSVRMPFDRAFHPVIADGHVVFGDSTDGTLRALDLKTGQIVWQFYTAAPVRFAPVIYKSRVYAGSDDGRLYCLNLKTGEEISQWRIGPRNDMLLGNGRMMGRWPLRAGPALRDGVLYIAAGIWPSEGIFLQARDPETGKILWENNDSGDIYMPQPHGGANAKSGISAQGYLVATADKLFVPTGRAVPAAFDRKSGKFLYYHLQKFGHSGGTPTMADGDAFFNSGLTFDAATGMSNGKLTGALAKIDGGLVRGSGSSVEAYRWKIEQKPDRKGNLETVRTLQPLWQASGAPAGVALLAAGKHVVTSAAGRVAIVDAEHDKPVWDAEVEGTPYALAVSDGCLLVGTDTGKVYCFASQPTEHVAIKPAASESPYDENPLLQQTAEQILAQSKITEGYALDFGCGDGQLAFELAKRSQLYIVALDADAENVRIAREKLSAAGLYGSRVWVHHVSPVEAPYRKYFANLIVSGRTAVGGIDAMNMEPARKFLRPYGGTLAVGTAADLTVEVRGDLPDAGRWTHQYMDASNSLCSSDTIQGPLQMAWFCDMHFEMPQRHGRGPAPLFDDGVLVIEGMDGLRGLDAYNGRLLWEHEIPGILAPYNADHLMGASGTGSNFCLGDGSVFVRHKQICRRLDLHTGKVLAEYTCPDAPDGKPGTWGYLAYSNGRLFGSVANTDHIPKHTWRPAVMKELQTESHSLFAMSPGTGKIEWQYDAEDSLRHNALAIGDGKVYLIDRALAEGDRQDAAGPAEHPTGKLKALDTSTGEVLWENEKDIYGTLLIYSSKYERLLMSYQPTRFRLPSEKGGRMAALDALTGKPSWDVEVNYASRPLINDQTVYAQGAQVNLLTGEKQTFDFDRSYGCGQLAGGQNLMLFRSATLGYVDLTQETKTTNYGGMRPGCWINALPVGGLVLVPEASAGCVCSYQNRAWVALEQMPREQMPAGLGSE